MHNAQSTRTWDLLGQQRGRCTSPPTRSSDVAKKAVGKALAPVETPSYEVEAGEVDGSIRFSCYHAGQPKKPRAMDDRDFDFPLVAARLITSWVAPAITGCGEANGARSTTGADAGRQTSCPPGASILQPRTLAQDHFKRSGCDRRRGAGHRHRFAGGSRLSGSDPVGRRLRRLRRCVWAGHRGADRLLHGRSPARRAGCAGPAVRHDGPLLRPAVGRSSRAGSRTLRSTSTGRWPTARRSTSTDSGTASSASPLPTVCGPIWRCRPGCLSTRLR